MAIPLNMQQMMLLIAERADMLVTDAVGTVGMSSFINKNALLYSINSELAKLWDVLISSYEDYAIKREMIDIVAGTDNYPLPKDFYKFRKIFPIVSGERSKAMSKFQLQDLGNEDVFVPDVSGLEVCTLRYRIMGARIWFDPMPTVPAEAEMWYVHQFDPVENDLDKMPFLFPAGWDDYVVEGCAAKLLEKEESDPTPYLRRQQAALERILMLVEDRDVGEPHQMIDTQGYTDYEVI